MFVRSHKQGNSTSDVSDRIKPSSFLPARSKTILASSESCFFCVRAAIDHRHSLVETRSALFRRELAGPLACFGGQAAPGGFLRVIDLLLCGALRVTHNEPTFPFPGPVVNNGRGFCPTSRCQPPGPQRSNSPARRAP